MELKSYQQQVIDDLMTYLEKVQETKDIQSAFTKFWNQHPVTPINPVPGEIIEPYKNNIKGVPHVCIKVPTAGGKTFIASNAIKTIFDAFDNSKAKSVVWLVPSITILEQTINNLSNPNHPYRQKINAHFQNRVEVYDKNDLLNGSNFNASTVKENLSIFVLSFDSLRARKKEDRKVYQENGNLLSFEKEIQEEEVSLMAVIKSLNPVVVVDESHNAETDLSVDMLTNLNPSFILDLTATPRKNSNIVSFVDAFELKKENMVKLPVIVYNQHDKTEVISSAIKLQRKLETEAIQEEKNGGKYIRPIVLLQAQPKGKEDSTTFEKIKDILIKSGIPENQIKIKTATINEIRGIDLMAKECEVRYIITINALKEGWDCPFAYVLASLADKSSAVDVEQILGRILRQPYVAKHKSALLNMSYVLTASSKFNQTLENIIKGLNRAGFSGKDYRLVNEDQTELELVQPTADAQTVPTTNLFEQDTEIESDELDDVNVDFISETINQEQQEINNVIDQTIEEITTKAVEEDFKMQGAIEEATKLKKPIIPADLKTLTKSIYIKEIFREEAKEIALPQFVLGQTSNLFGNENILVEKSNLIENFELEKSNININFEKKTTEMYSIDLDTTKTDNTPSYLKIDGKDRKILLDYFGATTTTTKAKINTLIARVKAIMGSMLPITDRSIDLYLTRIFETFDNDQYFNFIDNLYSHSKIIKDKINEEAQIYARKNFKDLIDVDKIELKPIYHFQEEINLNNTIDFISKSLYEKEGKMNDFEKEVISDVANSDNVKFWTRNPERTGFKINGFINHYPDFIIQTKKGNIIILETKGDHLDAADKIMLGNMWANKAGAGFKYFLVYNDREVDGAYTKSDFLSKIKEL